MLISGYAEDFFCKKGMLGKHFTFLQKPFTSEVSMGAVQTTLEAL